MLIIEKISKLLPDKILKLDEQYIIKLYDIPVEDHSINNYRYFWFI